VSKKKKAAIEIVWSELLLYGGEWKSRKAIYEELLAEGYERKEVDYYLFCLSEHQPKREDAMPDERLTEVTLVEKAILDLLPGEMTRNESRTHWLIGCPDCSGVGNLSGHTVILMNGLLSVSPSILCGCGAHYFVEKSEIKWC